MKRIVFDHVRNDMICYHNFIALEHIFNSIFPITLAFAISKIGMTAYLYSFLANHSAFSDGYRTKSLWCEIELSSTLETILMLIIQTLIYFCFQSIQKCLRLVQTFEPKIEYKKLANYSCPNMFLYQRTILAI